MKRLSFLAVAVVAAAACSDAFKPSTENVSGLYTLQSLTTDSAGVHKNWVAAGASLDLELTPGGLVGGQLLIPNAVGDTAAFIAFMDGTWTLTENTVHFDQTADTFVRDMDWIASENRLSGDKTFSGVRVRVVLAK